MFKMNEDFNKKYGYKNHEREFAKKNWKLLIIIAIVIYFLVEYL